jgi:phosphatidate cytidylyltransferase
MTSTRLLSALIFAAIYLTAMYWGPLRFIVPLIVIVGVVVGTAEYCQIARAAKLGPNVLVACLIAIALTVDGICRGMVDVAPILGAGLMLCGMSAVARNRIERATADIGATLFGGIFVALPLGLLMAMCLKPVGDPAFYQANFVLLFVVAVTWISDSGAYFVGKAWGRTKLCERLSPNKTVEGLLGGFAATVLAAILLRLLPIPGREIFSWPDTLALALAFCIIAPIGDLTESILKRDAGVKDSGADMTGHGGLLDIIDSLIFTAPATYLYFMIVGHEFLK